jgi:hypothetical protein
MLQPLNALFYFMPVEITKRFSDNQRETFIEVYGTEKNEMVFLIDDSIGITLDIETAEYFLEEFKKQLEYAKEGGSNE